MKGRRYKPTIGEWEEVRKSEYGLRFAHSLLEMWKITSFQSSRQDDLFHGRVDEMASSKSKFDEAVMTELCAL